MEYSDTDLGPRKTSAKNLAKKLIKDTKIKEAPVSLRTVIEFIQTTHDLRVIAHGFSDNVSGLLVKCTTLDDEYFVIGFNENQPWCRRRFTIAHEIGHLLFGHTCNKTENNKDDNEKEADIFAAELLIPKEILKRDFKATPKIDVLSKKYLVSQQAMSIKITSDRLI